MPESVTCPSCQKSLRLPEDLLGKKVKCPACAHMFVAEGPERTSGSRENVQEEPAPTRRRPLPAPDDDEDYEDTPRSRRRQREEDDEDYDDDEDRPRRRREPHRGGLILTLGILSLVICGILGPFAWVMGNNDLQEMRSGRMDRSGEGTTNAGRICGMISSILMIVACVAYGGIFMIAAMNARR